MALVSLGGGDSGYMDKEVDMNNALDALEEKRPCHGHSCIAVRQALQQHFRCQQDMIRSAKVRKSKRMGNIQIEKAQR